MNFGENFWSTYLGYYECKQRQKKLFEKRFKDFKDFIVISNNGYIADAVKVIAQGRDGQHGLSGLHGLQDLYDILTKLYT